MTGILISGKMSVGVRISTTGVSKITASAITMNVYGLDSARRTIHILFGSYKASSGAGPPIKLCNMLRRIYSLFFRFTAAVLWVRRRRATVLGPLAGPLKSNRLKRLETRSRVDSAWVVRCGRSLGCYTVTARSQNGCSGKHTTARKETPGYRWAAGHAGECTDVVGLFAEQKIQA